MHSTFLTVLHSLKAQEEKSTEYNCLLGWIKLSQLVSRFSDAGGPVTLTLPYMASGWLYIYLWVHVYLWVGAYYLGIYTLYAARRATKHLLCFPHIYLVSIFQTHFHFSHHCLITDCDSTLEVKIHMYPLHFNDKVGKTDCWMGGNIRRNQNCWGQHLIGSDLPWWNLRIWAKDKFKQFFLSEEYFLTGHWLETLFSQCFILKIKHTIIFSLKVENVCK